MWNNNHSGFHSQDNALGFDSVRASQDNVSGFGFDNVSGFAGRADSKSFKQMYNSDHHFQCHQHYTGSRLEACLQGVPWDSRSGRSGKGGGCGCR